MLPLLRDGLSDFIPLFCVTRREFNKSSNDPQRLLTLDGGQLVRDERYRKEVCGISSLLSAEMMGF